MAAAFAPHVASVVASDITDEMLAEAAKLAASRNLANMSTAKAEAGALPFPAKVSISSVAVWRPTTFPISNALSEKSGAS